MSHLHSTCEREEREEKREERRERREKREERREKREERREKREKRQPHLEGLVAREALLLAHPAVDGDGGEVALLQQLVQVRAALHGLDEDDNLAVAAQVALESKGLKPGFHFEGSRVETRRLQAETRRFQALWVNWIKLVQPPTWLNMRASSRSFSLRFFSASVSLM
jgi:hypothetical protein